MRRLLLGSVVVGAIGVVFLLTPPGRAILSLLRFARQAADREAEVTAASAGQPAALALARLCQSDPSLFRDEDPLWPAWAPVEVLRLRPTWVHVSEEMAHVEFGGGFHHFGYELRLDTTRSTATTNQWVLNFYSEGRAQRVLHTFTLAKSERVALRSFIDAAMAEYHRRAANGGREEDVRSRVNFLLKHGQQSLLVDSVHEFAARYPRDWLDQLLAMLIDGPADPAAQARLERWASREDDFTSWLFAAYGYDAAKDHGNAERCVRKALAAGPNEPSWCGTNARARGVPMCLRLHAAGRYATCVDLCHALLAYGSPDRYMKQELETIRLMSQRASAGEPVRNLTLPKVDVFDPFKGVDLQRLMALATTRPSATRTVQP